MAFGASPVLCLRDYCFPADPVSAVPKNSSVEGDRVLDVGIPIVPSVSAREFLVFVGDFE